jgi:hypothetical protein
MTQVDLGLTGASGFDSVDLVISGMMLIKTWGVTPSQPKHLTIIALELCHHYL